MTDPKKTKAVPTESRIIYVEPNDAAGHINGVPITPDYTDFCISFDLIVDVVSRVRNNKTITKTEDGGKSDNDKKANNSNEAQKTYVFSWTSKYDPYGEKKNENPNTVSFMGGVRYGKRDYLTTYYTDLHYNDFKNKTIVEGLGVESVNISFESYYAPMVKIRFIDVRGSSIFGREEVLHTDEVLAEDNIWGCFFTMPYPKYRLQVKGFYGRAVTFQLACTDFRANFNSNTGNYEIDMSFMGYDFGLLADVPMQYLIAAPYCRYADTMAYWNKKCDSDPDWQESHGVKPITFHDISQRITKIIEAMDGTKDGDNEATVEEIEEAVVDEELPMLEEIKSTLDSVYKKYDLDKENEKLTDNKVQKDAINTTYEYEKNFAPQSTTYTEINIVNKYAPQSTTHTEINIDLKTIEKLKRFYEKYKENYPQSTIAKSKDIFLQTEYIVNTDIKTGISESYPAITDQQNRLGVVALYNAFYNDYKIALNKPKTSTTRKLDISSSTVSKLTDRKIQDLVGFYPTIGNIFRLLYCHLETFVHMVYRCAGNIFQQMESEDRYPKKLGLSEQNGWNWMDIDDSKVAGQVDPFPGLYVQNNSDGSDDANGDNETDSDDLDVDAWPGEAKKDGSPVWEEELLVNELYKALLKTMMENSDNPANFATTKCPVLPCDIVNNTIAGIGMVDNPGELAGYLGIRAAALFGMGRFTDAEAEEVGCAEALNFYEGCASKDEINEKILNCIGNGDRTDTLYKTVLTDNSPYFEYDSANKQRLPFEQGTNLKSVMSFTNKKKDRHPIFVEKDGSLKYTYLNDVNGNAMIPIRMGSWKSLETIATYDGSVNGGYYTIDTGGNDSTMLYNHQSVQFLPASDDWRFFRDDEIFTVFYSGSYGDGEDIAANIEETYNTLKTGSININGYSTEPDEKRFENMLRNHWKNIPQDSFDSVYMTDLQSLYPPLEKLGFKPEDGIDSEGNFPSTSKEVFINVVNKNVRKSNGEFYYGDDKIEKEQCLPLIPELIYYTNNTRYIVNAFTSDIYYAQNGTTNDKTRECVKALIFLTTLNHGKDSDLSPSYIKNDSTTPSVIESVPLSVVLFHGALLWRKRYIELNNNTDPIEYPGVYKKIGENAIPILKLTTKYRGFIYKDSNVEYCSFTDVFGGFIDDVVANRLIKIFETFVDGEWKQITNTCELKGKGNTLLSYNDFVRLARRSKDETLSKLIGEICEKNSYIGNYFYMSRGEDEQNIKGVLSETNPAMSIIRKIYLSRIIVQKTVSQFIFSNETVSISPSTFKKYLNGFMKQLEEIAKSTTTIETTEDDDDDADKTNDIKRAIYMFVKNLWDRWFSSNNESNFSVKNYMRNTIFIDSMYRNVYDKIHINCEYLNNLITSSEPKSMVYKFMSDITTRHQCMFFAYPDYMNLGSRDNEIAIKNLESLFTPLPFSKIDNIETMNRYIVMFVQPPSKINETVNSYRYDSFDIYSHDGDPNSILPTFKNPCIQQDLQGPNVSDHDLQCSRYGYNVPAFGVEYARQNNAIFKNISVGMQNPIQTDQSINALSLIAERGRGAGKRTIFYGQDLYTVYQGYSYTATIQMMGNAQIMPMMYFQLFNVPMFRGSYMIYSVQHTMRPGDMTTTIKAMKMSKHTLPWCKEWYKDYWFDEYGNVVDGEDDICGGSSGKSCKGQLSKAMSTNIQGNNYKAILSSIGRDQYKEKSSALLNYMNNNVALISVKIRTTEKVKDGEYKTKNAYIVVNKQWVGTIKSIFEDIYNKTTYRFNTGQFAQYGTNGEKPLSATDADGKTISVKKGSPVIGCYQYRNTAKGTLSNHAFASAIDINPGYNPWLNCMDGETDDDLHIRTVSHPVVKIFANYGWGWGGYYGDFMHFSALNGN